MERDDFGFTNDETAYTSVEEFVKAALADGWEIEPTYGSEPVDRAFRLRRSGYLLQGINRRLEPGHKWKSESKIYGYGPDGMAIKVPRVYDSAALVDGVRRCNICEKEDVETFRYSFAGRACQSCIPEARRKHEYPGWNN